MEGWRSHSLLVRDLNVTTVTFDLTPWNMSSAQQESNAEWEETRSLLNRLLLAKLQVLRSVHVVLGCFSLGLALLMFMRILNDARRTTKIQVPLRPRYGCSSARISRNCADLNLGNSICS